MKIALAALMIATMPAHAESIGDRSNRQAYESQRGYASENKCFRYEYREEYVLALHNHLVMLNLTMKKLLYLAATPLLAHLVLNLNIDTMTKMATIVPKVLF